MRGGYSMTQTEHSYHPNHHNHDRITRNGTQTSRASTIGAGGNGGPVGARRSAQWGSSESHMNKGQRVLLPPPKAEHYPLKHMNSSGGGSKRNSIEEALTVGM
jgi:hypothetical protein